MPKRIPRWLWARLGRRGSMLLLLGIVHMLIGFGVWIRPSSDVQGSFLNFMPDTVQAVGWILGGAIGVIWAFRRHDSAGWLALYVMPVLRFFSYMGAWFVWLVTGSGTASAWYVAVLHVPLVLMVLICSGWREYRPEYPHEFEGG